MTESDADAKAESERVVVVVVEGKDETKVDTVILRVAVGSGNPCKIEAVRSAFERTFASSSSLSLSSQHPSPSSTHVPAVRIEVASYDVESGVSDQPFGDEETRRGATNRARAAWDAAVASASLEGGGDGRERFLPDFAVGLEGGVLEEEEKYDGSTKSNDGSSSEVKAKSTLWCMAWMAVLGTDSERCTLARADGSGYGDGVGNDDATVRGRKEADAPSRTGTTTKTTTTTKQEVWGYGRTGAFALPPRVARLVREGVELGEADDTVFRRIDSKRGDGTVGKLTKGMIDRSAYYDHALKLALVPWIQPGLYIYDDDDGE